MTQHETRDPYGQALSALRMHLAQGRFGWGEPLVVKDLAEEFGLSPTPVREALACLSGEGIIERRRGRGYHFPALTAPDIVDLYGLRWACVHAALALHWPGPSARQKIKAQADLFDMEELCRHLVSLTNNDAMMAAYDRLTDRLRPVRRAEAELNMIFLPNAQTLACTIAEDTADKAAEQVAEHHSNCCASASEAARFLQRSSGLKV